MRRFQQNRTLQQLIYFTHHAMRMKKRQPALISNDAFKMTAAFLLFSGVGVLSYTAYRSKKLDEIAHASIIRALNHIERELESINHELKWIGSRPNQRL